MALTSSEYFDLTRRIRMEQFQKRVMVGGYAEEGAGNLEKLQKELHSHRTFPKKGDLVTDHEWPKDGTGLVLEVRDRRKKNPYKLATRRCADWYGKEYVEYQCRIIS